MTVIAASLIVIGPARAANIVAVALIPALIPARSGAEVVGCRIIARAGLVRDARSPGDHAFFLPAQFLAVIAISCAAISFIACPVALLVLAFIIAPICHWSFPFLFPGP